MFDPDYRKTPWNRSFFKGMAVNKKGKGSGITTLSLIIVVFAHLAFVGAFIPYSQMNTTFLVIGLFSLTLSWGFLAHFIRSMEYSRLMRGIAKDMPSPTEARAQEKKTSQNRPKAVNPVNAYKQALAFLYALAGVLFVVALYLYDAGLIYNAPRQTLLYGAFILCLLVLILWMFRATFALRKTRQTIQKPAPEEAPLELEMPPSQLGIIETQDLHHKDFEHEVAWVISAISGHQARVVGGSGDGGADIKIYHKKTGALMGFAQCKKYRPDKAIAPLFVRELYTVKERLGVKHAYLITTAYFTEQTQALAKELQITLVDGTKLRELQTRARGQIQIIRKSSA